MSAAKSRRSNREWHKSVIVSRSKPVKTNQDESRRKSCKRLTQQILKFDAHPMLAKLPCGRVDLKHPESKGFLRCGTRLGHESPSNAKFRGVSHQHFSKTTALITPLS